MINFRNKRLAAFTAIAGLGIGALATPAVALAAPQSGHAKVVRSDPPSPDKTGTHDGARRDAKVDKTSSVDKSPSIDRSTSVDPRTDH